MNSKTWALVAGPGSTENPVWELFHENSKMSPHRGFMPDGMANIYLRQMPESLWHQSSSEVKLPIDLLPLRTSLSDAIMNRAEARGLAPCSISLQMLATLLRYGYGCVTDSGAARRPRVVPSEGSLYPLELFFYTSHVEDLAPGLYHYDVLQHSVSSHRASIHAQGITAGLVAQRLASDASIMVLVTAMPERAVFKYGDRGYRFVMLEAGAVVQNLNLVAGALGLACVNSGMYFDREVDSALGFDGLTMSTLYLVSIGSWAAQDPDRELTHLQAGAK